MRVDFFDKLVGEGQNPESSILFAAQGHGKTSHRLEVARLSAACVPPTLGVVFSEFDILLHSGTQTFSAEAYLPVIRRKILESLIHQFMEDSERREHLQQKSKVAARFCALQQLYAKPIEVISPPEQTTSLVGRYQKNFTVVEWLKELVDIVQQSGFASIYFLIDGVDEWTETQQNPTLAVNLLKPLLEIAFSYQVPGFACKFFLPDYLEELIRQHWNIDLDRVSVYRLKWSDAELRDLLAKRLTSFCLMPTPDAAGNINRFSDLCSTHSDVDAQLIRVAHSSPRRLIDLARQIVERHCANATDVAELISTATINAVLDAHLQRVQPALVKRELILTYIETKLYERRGADVQAKKRIMNVYGMSGVGKSCAMRQIVKQFAHKTSIVLCDFDPARSDIDEFFQRVDGEVVYSWEDAVTKLQPIAGSRGGRGGAADVHEQRLHTDQRVVYVSEPADLQQTPGLLLLDSVDNLSYWNWKWVQQNIIQPLLKNPETLVVVASQSPLHWHVRELRDRCEAVELRSFSLEETQTYLADMHQDHLAHLLYRQTAGYPRGLRYIITPVLKVLRKLYELDLVNQVEAFFQQQPAVTEMVEEAEALSEMNVILSTYRETMLEQFKQALPDEMRDDLFAFLASAVAVEPTFNVVELRKKLKEDFRLPPGRINEIVSVLYSRGFFTYDSPSRAYQLHPALRTLVAQRDVAASSQSVAHPASASPHPSS